MLILLYIMFYGSTVYMNNILPEPVQSQACDAAYMDSVLNYEIIYIIEILHTIYLA